ncbi:hypothetical protein [Serratia symbiotica]|uniref:hypothetical protein n=1 Tax=Serratia symbiotica TaxID=138074 RepID=UPI001CF02D3B|nr:hypothetical protein [Serratia symbiotica]
MLHANSIAGFPSASRTLVSQGSSNQEDQDIWFDAIDHVEMEETWFDAIENHEASPTDAGEAAEFRVPLTEDCRRGVQQLVRTLGGYGESRILSACLSKILPGTPTSLVIAANSLYTAVTDRRNIDAATLHVLGLASWCLPENINVVSRLAAFIRDTVTGWTDDTFLQQFLGEDENHTSIHLFTALAVTAIVAGRWMKDEGSPQRGPLKVPAFMAYIFIRASHYWIALGNMASSLPSSAEMLENNEPSRRVPAFEVDTQVEMTGDVCDAAVPCSSSAPRLTAFSSNSTATPGSYIRAMVQNRPASAPGKNAPLSVPEQAHLLAVERLREKSGLSALPYCTTLKTETRQQTNEKVVTATHFNTKCDAITYPEPLRKATESTPVHTDIPETRVSSSATSRSGGDVLLPLVMTAAAAPVATSYMQALKSKPVIAAGAATALTGLIVGRKLLRDSLRTTQTKLTEAGGGYDKITDSETIRIREKQNELIDKLLTEYYKNDLPDKNSRINNIVEYVTSDNRDEKVAEVARALLTPAGLYGSGNEDDFTYNKNAIVIAEYLADLILGTSVDKWIIEDSMRLLKNGNNVIHGNLVRNYFNKINDNSINISKKARIFIQENLLKRKFPIFLSNIQGDELNTLNKISAFSPRWGMIHAGAMFLSEIDATLDDHSLEAIQDVGVVLFNLMQEGGLPLEFFSYFRLPALIYYFHSMNNISFDDMGDGSDVFINYTNMVKEWYESNDPFFLLSKSVKDWKTRTQLAQNLLNSKNITKYSVTDYLNSHGEVDIEGSDGNVYTFPDIDIKFEQQNKKIGKLFSVVQKINIIGVYNKLSEDEQDFIVNSEARRIKFEFNGQSMVRGKLPFGKSGIAYNKVFRYFLPDDRDFIQYINGEEERIYSLEVLQGTGHYAMIRVDRDRDLLLSYLDDVLPGGSENYELRLLNKQILKEKDEPVEMLINNIVNLHKKKLTSYLYNKGYDKTSKEKISDFLLSLVPFYTCVTESINGNFETSVPSCIIDVASLTPFLYSAAKVGMRFNISLGNASIQAMKYGLLKSTLKASANEAGKVMAKEFPSIAHAISPDVIRALSINLARCIDPGFGLIFFAGKKGLLKIKNRFKTLENKKILLEGLVSSLDKKISSITTKAVSNTPETFWCPVYNEKIVVYRVEMVGNREVWAQFNKETQVFFGEKFVREPGKEIRPLSHLARENVSIKTEFNSLEEINEELLFRRTSEGYMLSCELADRIINDAESVLAPVPSLSNAEQEQNLVINLEGRAFHAIPVDEQIYKLSNRLKGEENILIYKYDELIFELKPGTDTITGKCRAKRSPSDTPGPSVTDVCDATVTDYVRGRLNPLYKIYVDERNILVNVDFPNTFINKENNKLYFKYNGNYYKCKLIPKSVSRLQQDMLTIYHTDKTSCFLKNKTLVKVVALDVDGSAVITSDVELISGRTGIAIRRTKGMTAFSVRWQKLKEIMHIIAKSNDLLEVPYRNVNSRVLNYEYISSEITKKFFNGNPQWTTTDISHALGSGLFHVRSSAVVLRNHRDFAIDNLRIAIDYLSAKDKSTQLNLYLSSILNTDNKEIIEKFADQLSSRYREIKKNLQNAQLVLCYSAKELISNVKPEVDFFRDNNLLPQEQDTPWENVYWRPNLNQAEIARGSFAFTFPSGDVYNRIWINLDRLYFSDPTHPINFLRKPPVIKQFLVLIHEASHQKNLAKDIIYVPIENEVYIPILDALDVFSSYIKSINKDRKFVLKQLAVSYFSKRKEYKKMPLKYLLFPSTLQYIFEHDPNFRALILKGIPDFLALMVKDINNIYNLKLAD